MNNDQTPDTVNDDIDPIEMRIWIEFSAWCALVMTPIIWWLQGPSVSTDQFVVRTGLVILSAAVGIGMRIWAIVSPYSLADQLSQPAASPSSPEAAVQQTTPASPKPSGNCPLDNSLVLSP